MADGDQNWVKFPDGRFYPYDKSVPDQQILDDMEKMRQNTAAAPAAKEAKEAKEEPGTPPVPGAAAVRNLMTGTSTSPVPGAETAGRVAGRIAEGAKRLWGEAITPSPPTKEGKPTEPSIGRKLLNLTGLGEGALFGGTGEAGGIGGGGYRAEDVAAPFVLGAGEAALPIAGRAAEKYMPATTGLARRIFGRTPEANVPRETMPGTRPAEPTEPLRPMPGPVQGPRLPTAGEQLEPVSQRLFKKPYNDLTTEQQLVVGRNVRPPGAERRVTVGQGPTFERRAENMPLPTISPEPIPERRLEDLGAPGGIERRAAQEAAEMRGPDYQPTNVFEDFNRENRARINRAIEEERGLGGGTLPPAPPPTTLPGGPARPGGPSGTPPATLDEILRKATGQPELPRAVPGEPLRPPEKK